MSVLHEAIKRGVEAALRGLCVGMPGELVAYDFQTRKGEVKPLIQEKDAQGVFRALKPIRGVPVHQAGGKASGSYFPPEPGDTGWISFSHRSLDLWLERGGDQPTEDDRVMDMSDAVFFPGLRPFSELAGPTERSTAAVVRNGSARLVLEGGKLAVGNTDAIALPTPPGYTGPIELMAFLDFLVESLTDVSLVTGSATINPAFTAKMLALLANLQQLKGSL